MINLFTLEVSLLYILELTIIAIFIGIGILIISRILLKLRNKSSVLKRIYRLFPLITFLTLIALFSISAYVVLKKNPLYTFTLFVTIIIFLGILSYKFILDLGSGIVLMAENNLEPGLRITLGDHKGEIKKAGMLSVSLLQSDGSLIRIPYHKLARKIINISNLETEVTGYSFSLQIDRNISLVQLEKKIKEVIFHYPWTSLGREPILKEISNTGQKTQLEITIYTVGNLQYRDLEKKILALV